MSGRRDNNIGSKIARFWRTSYAPDWLGLLLLVVGYVVLMIPDPYHRMFSLDDRRIQFPHAEIERVPLSMLFVYSIGFPVALMTLYLVGKPRSGESSKWHQLHVSLLGLFISLMLTSLFTDLVKNGVGRPRPDLIARCKPKEGTPEHELVTWEVCTETDHHTLHDGFRSFPSGHSSFAFSGLGYLSLFLLGQLQALRKGADITKVIIGIIPILGALAIAISRTEDYRHDAYDVTLGSLIGLFVTYFSYRRYFPSLRSVVSDEPYPGRGDSDNEKGPRGFEVLRSPDLEMQEFEDE
ncbi:phosphatidic acid phosphatase type 2/haloperoxidase [Peziza echinospora]|nr:phosphatidic acid phosphatase type 2/haloperoxidase [Peziza echinospora]